MAVLDLAASSELCEDNNSKWKNTLLHSKPSETLTTFKVSGALKMIFFLFIIIDLPVKKFKLKLLVSMCLFYPFISSLPLLKLCYVTGLIEDSVSKGMFHLI